MARRQAKQSSSGFIVLCLGLLGGTRLASSAALTGGTGGSQDAGQAPMTQQNNHQSAASTVAEQPVAAESSYGCVDLLDMIIQSTSIHQSINQSSVPIGVSLRMAITKSLYSQRLWQLWRL